MLVVLEDCNIGVSPDGKGGLVVRMENITGLDGVTLLLPIEGKEVGGVFVKNCSKAINMNLVEVADNAGMQRAVRDAGA